MADFNNEWIEIFRVGDYGAKGKYTAADLDQMVRNFQPATHEPPLALTAGDGKAQIGHDDAAPALGWVKDLRQDGQRLFAQFRQVHPKLEELVRDGRYPKRSVGLYRNPEGKGLMLRHVAFLGAVPPEVKGLANISFRDGEFVAIEFEESPPGEKEDVVDLKEVQKTVRESIRDFFAPLFGEKQPAAPAFTEDQLNGVVSKAVEAAVQPLKTQITALLEDNQKLRRESAASQTSAQLAQFDERVAAQQKAGKIVPAMSGTIALMRERVAQGGTVKFTENAGTKDAREVERPVLEFALAELDRLPQIVPAGDLAGEAHRAHNVVEMKFNETDKLKTDAASVQLNARAEAIAADLRKQDPKLSEGAAFGEALRRARQETSVASAGGMTAGRV
jgi:hypothetical protein